MTESSLDTGRFHNFQLVAKSRASQVYCAHDRQLNRKVAIKAIAIDQHRNNSEVEIHKDLHHPNILKLIDAFRDSTCHYLVFPWLKNGSIASRLRQPNWSIEDRIHVFQQLLQAISFLHSRDIVHGDIKPQNCLFDDHGFILLADFGNARPKQWNMELESKFVGSPAYMAPELIRQESTVSKASDIYALGIVLYELLSEANAFPDDLSASIYQTLQDKNLAIDKATWSHRTCLTDWNTVIAVATHRQVDRRYVSVDDLIGEIRSIVDGRPIKSRPCGIPERFVRWTKREPRTTRWVLASVLILVFSFATAMLGWVRSNARYREMQETRAHYDLMTAEFESKRFRLNEVLEKIRENTQIAEKAELEAGIHERDTNSKDIELATTGSLSSEIQRTNERLLQDISSAKLEIDSANSSQRARLEQEAMVQKIISLKGRLEAYFNTIQEAESLITRNDPEAARAILNKTDAQCRGIEFGILEDQVDGVRSATIQDFSPVPGEGNGKSRYVDMEPNDGIVPVFGASSFITINKSKTTTLRLMQWSKDRRHDSLGILASQRDWAKEILCNAFSSTDGNGVLLVFRKDTLLDTKDDTTRLVETKVEIDDAGNRVWTIVREFRPDIDIFDLRYDHPGRVICLGTKGNNTCIWSSTNESSIWTSPGQITWNLSALRPDTDFVFCRLSKEKRQPEIDWIRVNHDDTVRSFGTRSIETPAPDAYPLTRELPYNNGRKEIRISISQLSQTKPRYVNTQIRFSLAKSCSDTVFCGFFPSLDSHCLILRSNIAGLDSSLWKSEALERRYDQKFTFLENDGLAEPRSTSMNYIYRISNQFQNKAERVLGRPKITQEEFELGMNRFLDFVSDKALTQLIEIEF